ncbi:MAG: alpha/beta hydrolase [Bacteroidia bacterium]|nr:alpha/beta hydrolase [Bacteroidia bacterium]
MLLDHPLISQSYFFPRWAAFRDAFWVETGGERLACYYHNPFPYGNTVIFFHGNGEVVADYIQMLPPLLEKLGWNCLLAEYRGYGMSTGKPALTAMLADAVNIARSAESIEQKLVFFGRSVGSIYAIHCAGLFREAAGLIVESGIADVRERLLLRVRPREIGVTESTFDQEVRQYFDTEAKLSRFEGATLILHTQHDELVNVSHAEQLYDWSSQPKTMERFSKGGHNDIFFRNQEAYLESLEIFLGRIKS